MPLLVGMTNSETRVIPNVTDVVAYLRGMTLSALDEADKVRVLEAFAISISDTAKIKVGQNKGKNLGKAYCNVNFNKLKGPNQMEISGNLQIYVDRRLNAEFGEKLLRHMLKDVETVVLETDTEDVAVDQDALFKKHLED